MPVSTILLTASFLFLVAWLLYRDSKRQSKIDDFEKWKQEAESILLDARLILEGNSEAKIARANSLIFQLQEDGESVPRKKRQEMLQKIVKLLEGAHDSGGVADEPVARTIRSLEGLDESGKASLPDHLQDKVKIIRDDRLGPCPV